MNRDFENAPLITPERIEADPEEAFRVVPRWAATMAFAQPDLADLPAADRPVVVLVGGKHRVGITLSSMQFGLLCEGTRFGHSVVTNRNSGKQPTIYAKLSFRDAPHDNMPISRPFAGAGANEQVKAQELRSDLRTENLYLDGAGKPIKYARATTMLHVRRLAKERQSSGTLPVGFDVDAYLENVERLFDRVAGSELGEAA